MQLMKGKISLLENSSIEEDTTCIIIDCDLLYNVKNSFILQKQVELTELGGAIVRALVNLVKKHNIDEVIFVSVGNNTEYADIALSLLLPQYTVIKLDTEESYKAYLKVKKPLVHISTVRRQNYYRSSIYAETYLYGESINGENKEKTITRGGKL